MKRPWKRQTNKNGTISFFWGRTLFLQWCKFDCSSKIRFQKKQDASVDNITNYIKSPTHRFCCPVCLNVYHKSKNKNIHPFLSGLEMRNQQKVSVCRGGGGSFLIFISIRHICGKLSKLSMFLYQLCSKWEKCQSL